MKRIITTTSIMIAVMLSAMAGNPDKLFKEFKNLDNAEYVNVPRALLWAAATTSGEMNDIPLTKKMTNIKVLTLSDSKLTARFEKRLSEETAGLDDLVKTTDDGETVRIFTRLKKDEKLENIYIYTTDRSESTFVCLKGKFTLDDISQITKKK